MGFSFFISDLFGTCSDKERYKVSLRDYLTGHATMEDAATEAHQDIATRLKDAVAEEKYLTIDLKNSDGFGASFLWLVFSDLQKTSGLNTAQIERHLKLSSSGVAVMTYHRYIHKYIRESHDFPAPRP